jgi:hypothetical protein
MTVLSDIFPTLCQALPPFESSTNIDGLETQPKFFVQLSIRMLQALEHAFDNRPTPEAFQFCRTVLSEIIACKAHYPDAEPGLNFLQFITTIIPTEVALHLGDFDQAHRWCVDAFADDLTDDPERTAEFQRLILFRRLADDDPDHIVLINSISRWAISFYHYAWKRAALTEGANVLAEVTRSAATYLVHNGSTEQRQLGVSAISSILNWANQSDQGLAIFIASSLESWHGRPPLEDEISNASIEVALSTSAGNLTRAGQPVWASIALMRPDSVVPPLSKIEIHGWLFNDLNYWETHRDTVLQLITRVHEDSASVAGGNQLVMMNKLESSITAIHSFVGKLISFGRASDLVNLLQAWYGIDDAIVRKSPALILSAHHQRSMAYAADDWVEFPLPPENTDAAQILESTINRALNLFTTFRGEDVEMGSLEMHGRPDYSLAAEFKATVNEHFCFENISERLTDIRQQKNTTIIMIPATRVPLQSLMLQSIGFSFPMSVSLEEPLPDRQVKRVGIWCAEADYYAHFEIDGMTELLERADISVVTRQDSSNSAADTFLEFFSDPAFDVIHIATHGEYDQWKPTTTTLVLNEAGTAISLEQLLGAKDHLHGDCRRLLILNACDIGAAATTGGLHRVGFGPALASRHQAVVSNLWPAHPQVAAAFGMFLANRLAAGDGFFDSFQSALQPLVGNDESIGHRLVALGEQPGILGERFANSSLGTDNIFHWGTPVFLE